jgi:hypothetical protein
MRSGISLSGKFYIVSFYKHQDSVVIEAQNAEGPEPLTLVIQEGDAIETRNTKAIDAFCNNLLNRLQVESNESGEPQTLILAEEENDPSTTHSIVYKRSHYISNRYFIITVYYSNVGLTISAFEPEKS